MDLDATLSDEIRDAIDMGLHPEMAEGKDKKGNYPEVSKGQFADPANRAFPINTAARCRSAMVYLNKYHNNPSASGVTKNYSEAKFREVHNRIVAAMKKFGIEHDGCSICKKSKASDSTKGGIEDMADETKLDTEEIVETEASEETPEEETVEEVEASEEVTEEVEASEDEVLDTDVEPDEAEEAAEAAASEETVEEPVEEPAEPDVKASEEEPLNVRLRNALTALSEVVEAMEPKEAEASEEPEASEMDMLAKELADTKAELATYKARELGIERLASLAAAGITFDEEKRLSKIERFGTMSEDDFVAYAEDLANVVKASKPVDEAKASTKKEEPRGIQTPPQFLPNVEDPAQVSEIEAFVNLYK